MQIKVLVENTTKLEEFPIEHGLSIYIEMGNHKILFDLGKSGVFLENAKRLQVPIEEVDTVIISHGHYDHGGGLDSFLKANSKAKIYLHENAFHAYYAKRLNGKEEYIGLDQKLKDNPRLILGDGNQKIDRGIVLFSGVKTKEFCSISNLNLMEKVNGKMIPDNFCHEQNLILTENGKKVLISGCSHNGILNILNLYLEREGRPADIVIGGFHLCRPETGESEDSILVKGIARRLAALGSQYYTCHCTGEAAFDCLKEIMKEQIDYLSGGMELVL